MKFTNKKALIAAFAIVFGLTTLTVSADHHDMDSMHEQHHEAVMLAIQAGDYDQLPEEKKEDISEEDFAKKVKHHADMMEHHEALEEVIANKDYDGFVLLMEEHKEEKKMHKEEECAEGDHDGEEDDHKKDDRCDREMKEMNEADLQEKMHARYDELVAYYDENGELPKMKKKMKNMKENVKKMNKEERKELKTDIKNMKKERKFFKEKHRSAVKGVVNNVSEARLKKALARIDAVLLTATDEKTIDLIEGIRDVIVEALGE